MIRQSNNWILDTRYILYSIHITYISRDNNKNVDAAIDFVNSIIQKLQTFSIVIITYFNCLSYKVQNERKNSTNCNKISIGHVSSALTFDFCFHYSEFELDISITYDFLKKMVVPSQVVPIWFLHSFWIRNWFTFFYCRSFDFISRWFTSIPENWISWSRQSIKIPDLILYY